jgi:hypothetical protein
MEIELGRGLVVFMQSVEQYYTMTNDAVIIHKCLRGLIALLY